MAWAGRVEVCQTGSGFHVQEWRCDCKNRSRRETWRRWFQRYGRNRIEPVNSHDDGADYLCEVRHQRIRTGSSSEKPPLELAVLPSSRSGPLWLFARRADSPTANDQPADTADHPGSSEQQRRFLSMPTTIITIRGGRA